MARSIVTKDDIKDLSVSGGGHQIFEIFQSLRKGETDIDGAYPCDGREFSKSDFTGGNNPYDMLLLNKAKTLSYEEWNTEVTAKGVCFSFALDEENEKFKIPKLINDTIPTLTGTVGDVGKSDVANTGSGRNIGETVFSLIPLSDAGLHLLDGSLLNVGGIYDEAITKIAALKSSNPALFVTEENWQQSVTTYGVCGKFVYTEGVSLRLPKVTGFVEGTLDATALGDLVEAGLPDLTAYWNVTGTYAKDTAVSGAAARYHVSDWDYQTVASSNIALASPYLEASRQNPLYGNSTTVQPQAIKGYLYMVVATSVKTDIQVDIDQIATDLNGKADTNLSNLSATGKTKVAHLAMPSDNYVDLTPPQTGADYVFTAPADGYVCFRVMATEAYQNLTVSVDQIASANQAASAGYWMSATVPVRKGKSFAYYWTGGNTKYFRFYYAEGSQS